MQNANPSFISGLRRGRTSRRAQRRRTLGAGHGANESSPLITNVDNSQFQTDVYEHVTEFIDNVRIFITLIHLCIFGKFLNIIILINEVKFLFMVNVVLINLRMLSCLFLMYKIFLNDVTLDK